MELEAFMKLPKDTSSKNFHLEVSYCDVSKLSISARYSILSKKLTAILVNADQLIDERNQFCLEYIKEEWYKKRR